MDICYPVGHHDRGRSAMRSRGVMRLQQTDLPLCVMAAVTTSRVARGYPGTNVNRS